MQRYSFLVPKLRWERRSWKLRFPFVPIDPRNPPHADEAVMYVVNDTEIDENSIEIDSRARVDAQWRFEPEKQSDLEAAAN